MPPRSPCFRKGGRRRDVKWFDPAGYARYRDVGLLGLARDGSDDPTWRGRNDQRDGVFADGLYGTGLRLTELGSLLLAELPRDDPARGYFTCVLAAATAKGGYPRRYWMPRPVLADVSAYVETDRAATVRRAQREGRYEQVGDRRLVVGDLGGGRLRLRALDGAVQEVSLDALSPRARRRLFRPTAGGLEPVALWLNGDGMPRDPHGWEHTFDRANRRLARLGFECFAGTPHMLRHSFALRWFSVGRLLYEKRFAHLSEEETRDFRAQFGNTWHLVQTLLGHRCITTTVDIYLEPFRTLDVELLLLHAGNIAVPDVMGELFRGDRRVLTDPVAAGR